jgi:hypothetical protein
MLICDSGLLLQGFVACTGGDIREVGALKVQPAFVEFLGVLLLYTQFA